MYHDDIDVGYIGANQMRGYTDRKGLVFDLNSSGSYTTWASYEGGVYNTKLLYARNTFSNFTADTLHAGCNLDMQNYRLKRAHLENIVGVDGYTPLTGNFHVVTGIRSKSDGGIEWSYGTVTIRGGLITSWPSRSW